MMDLASFFLGFWIGADVIIFVWMIHVANKRKKEAKQKRSENFTN